MQYLGHLLLAFNRCTVFWFPLTHERVWRGNWYIYVMIGLPFLHVCYKLHEPGRYVFGEGNTTVIGTLANGTLHSITYFISTVIYSIITALAAFFNGLSFIKFKSSKHSTSNSEKSLFCKFYEIPGDLDGWISGMRLDKSLASSLIHNLSFFSYHLLNLLRSSFPTQLQCGTGICIG